jgi:hypothetical protein
VAEVGWLLRDRGGRCGREFGVAPTRDVAEDVVSLGEAVGARDLDRPRDVSAEYRRQLRFDESAPVFPIDRVDGCRAYPDQYLAVPGLGPFDLLEPQHIRASGLVDHHGSHGHLLLAKGRR